MNSNDPNIGWDDHLEREWNRHTDAQDAYEREHMIEQLRDDIADLEDEVYDLEDEGQTVEAGLKRLELKRLEDELKDMLWGKNNLEED